MRSVLGIVGSPRKNGNTHVLVNRMLEGAKEAGASVRTLLLGDLSIRECDGCHVCWTGKECPKNDDMNAVYGLIGESDAIIFGTPVYWYGPTALMKGFIDRFVYFNCPENREKVRGKPVAIAVPFEESDVAMASLVIAFFEKSFHYLEMDFAGQVIVPGVTAKGEVSSKTDLLEEAYALGKRLAT